MIFKAVGIENKRKERKCHIISPGGTTAFIQKIGKGKKCSNENQFQVNSGVGSKPGKHRFQQPSEEMFQRGSEREGRT